MKIPQLGNRAPSQRTFTRRPGKLTITGSSQVYRIWFLSLVYDFDSVSIELCYSTKLSGRPLMSDVYDKKEEMFYVLLVMIMWFSLLAHSCHKFTRVLAYHSDWNECKIDQNYRMYIHSKGNLNQTDKKLKKTFSCNTSKTNNP